MAPSAFSQFQKQNATALSPRFKQHGNSPKNRMSKRSRSMGGLYSRSHQNIGSAAAVKSLADNIVAGGIDATSLHSNLRLSHDAAALKSQYSFSLKQNADAHTNDQTSEGGGALTPQQNNNARYVKGKKSSFAEQVEANRERILINMHKTYGKGQGRPRSNSVTGKNHSAKKMVRPPTGQPLTRDGSSTFTGRSRAARTS